MTNPSYSSILHDVLLKARDIMREDTTLCGTTILNLPGVTTQAYNYIFAGRPANQITGFTNPRIICEDQAIHVPNNYGGNPDGLHDDSITFQISTWKDFCALNKKFLDVERIRYLFDNVEFDLTEGGKGFFKVNGVNVNIDPDKANTYRGVIVINANIISGG